MDYNPLNKIRITNQYEPKDNKGEGNAPLYNEASTHKLEEILELENHQWMLKLMFSISLTKNTIDIVSKNLPHKLLSNFKGER